MSKFTKEEIFKKVTELSKKGSWNHFYDFSNGVKTFDAPIKSPGYSPNKWARLKNIIDSLDPSGKTLIDVGCSDGFFSIMSARKNMSKVKGIDPDPLRIEKANFAKEVYDIKNVKFEVADLYKLPEGPDDQYDIVLGLGLLHRVPDLDKCIDKLCAIGKNIILEFKTLDEEEPKVVYHGGNSKSNEWNGLHYTPTKQYVIDRMASNGLPNFKTIEDNDSGLNYKRTIMLFSVEEV